MDEHDDLIKRLRRFGRRPIRDEVSAGHLAAIEAASGANRVRNGAHRLRIIVAFAVGLVAGTSGLATAGALPDGAQEVAHRTLGAVGIKVPHGDRYWGQECVGEVKKNHGQYVRSRPKDQRGEAAASRCGKPVQAGAGDDDPAGGGAGTGAGCQGPPPWAGKGKPDEAAKEARKQACGQRDDEGGDEPAPGPSAQTEPTVPLTPDPLGATPSTTEPPVETTTTTVSPGTATTGTTATTTTTAPSGTTSTTTGSDGATTPSLPVEPPAAGQAS